MAKRPPFTFVFAPEAFEHLEAIDLKFHREIQEAIEVQLTHSPDKKTRNRKPLDQPAPFEATWELRCGPGNRFRVLYEFDPVALAVSILAIGEKDRNRLYFSGEEFIP